MLLMLLLSKCMLPARYLLSVGLTEKLLLNCCGYGTVAAIDELLLLMLEE